MGRRSKRQAGRPLPPIVQPPPQVTANIDRITGADRDWFASHPDANQRIRPAAPDEFWPVSDSASVLYVIVRQVRPGFRFRFPIIRINQPETERIQ